MQEDSSVHDEPGTITRCIIELRHLNFENFGILWNFYFPKLIRRLELQFPGNPAIHNDAEDLSAEALEQLAKLATSEQRVAFVDRDGLWRFLSLVVYRNALQTLRRKQSDPLGERRLLGQRDVNQTLRFLNENLFDRSPNHEEAIQFADQFDWILDSLGEPLSSIALLTLEGRNQREIANRLDLTKRIVERKIELIRSILSDMLFDDP